MKKICKILGWIVSIIVGILVFCILVLATANLIVLLKEPAKVKYSDNITASCNLSSGYGEVWGCYRNNTIIINSNVPYPLNYYVYWHEVGYSYIKDIPSSTLQKVINPLPALEEEKDIYEISADHMASYLLDNKSVSPQEQLFFSNIIKNK